MTMTAAYEAASHEQAIELIIEALQAAGINAKESRDGETVVVGLGAKGFIRVYPEDRARIDGKGYERRKIADALDAAGIPRRTF